MLIFIFTILLYCDIIILTFLAEEVVRMQNSYDFSVTHVYNSIERKTTKGWSFNATISEHYIIAINLGGIGEYDISGHMIKVVENDLILFSPRTARKCVTDEFSPWHFISISFDIEYGEGSELIVKDEPVVIHNVSRQISELFKKINNARKSRSKIYRPLCNAYIQEILCYVAEQNEAVAYNPVHYAKIENVKKYINDNFTKNISVDELAEIAGLSPSHFRKVFREIVGMSATQYAIYMRINKAKDLLASGTVNVSEAAFQSGFKDIYYFSSMFKKITGENPSKYFK